MAKGPSDLAARGAGAGPTEICITVDTEFTVNGAFHDPDRCAPIGEDSVTCRAGGREQGLGFMLETFAAHGIAATFFVEALNTVHFGDAPMGRVVERLLAAGQDVQLHLHPCWLTFDRADWRSRLDVEPPNDDCSGRSRDEVGALIARGLSALRRWGVAAPAALRTGNLQTDRTVYAAMAEAGLSLASNVGLGLSVPDDPALRLACGRHRIGAVLEVPVTTYTQLRLGGQRWRRLLTTTASSFAETRALLRRARAAGLSPVVLLTHASEFAKGEGAARRANRVNQRRLALLCRFIAAHPDEFVPASFAASGPRWQAEPPQPAHELTAPPAAVAARVVSNAANDLIPWL